MPKREPNFPDHPNFWASNPPMVAVGAVHPGESGYLNGTTKGQNHDGYDEPVLVYPGLNDPKLVDVLQMSKVADCALRVRDNLLARPNRLNRNGGPLQSRNTTWVLCQQDGFFFRPVAAEVGGEPVPQELLMSIWENVRES